MGSKRYDEDDSILKIDRIEKGLVIDHIAAGKSMNIYHYLDLAELDCAVAIIKNVKSKRMGRKDLIKIENNIDIDLDILGYIDPRITVNIIEDGKITDKKKSSLPEQVRNVVKCKNPRCITSIEQEIDHIFELYDNENQIYRCIYCEQEAPRH